MYNTPNFKVTRSGAHPIFSGKLTAPSTSPVLSGTPVIVGGTGTASGLHDDATIFSIPDGVEGRLLFLKRKVLGTGDTEIPLTNLVWDNEPVVPVLSGTYVDAVHVEEIEVEGDDYIFTTANDGQEITGSTAAGTRLTLKEGKWAVIDTVASQAVHGRLIKQLTPIDSGTIRIAIEVFSEGRFDKVV